ncbi:MULTISPECIES: hypothetical protein [Reichenbachiella]|uniref:Uncharacterized protein n=1 Tax=Reichenbachiella agariperforans TaxID=156994 RepID=A0A1M6JC88_REIAG|nr:MULTISPECIES: hypothetical protein [Reichenbachiella]MBU2913143.1 hypothetical protein [Reichenbachiella agariperforans]RJE74859.1 hypothetical protein BGP76_17180 [Reichenbachiella sp. MSK19-1]SHJ44321.1 hypothetical protein SAMN04488028_101134 [Reichenbachiella agariperforans]
MKELYHEEQKILSDYVGKVKQKDLSMDDAVGIAVHYKDLLDQSKVITRISDRLQKKLDHANQKIKSQNSEIQKKNVELEDTINELDKMTVGKKASRIMFALAIILFVSEEQFLGPIIEDAIDIPYLGLLILLIIAMFLKFFEGMLESYFLKQTKKKILSKSSLNKDNTNLGENSSLSYSEK